MKKIILNVLAVVLLTALVLVSCDKKDTTPDTSNSTTGGTTSSGSTSGGSTTGGSTTSGPPAPVNATVNGVFIGIKSKVSSFISIPGTTITSSSDVFSEFASTNLYATAGSTTAVDGGTVACNDSLLQKNSNNSYSFTKVNSNLTTGFTSFYNGGSSWKVQGNTTNGVPAITGTSGVNLNVFPSVPNNNYSSTPTITTTTNFLVNHGAISNCDSLVYQMTGGNGTIFTSKAKAGNQTSYTFTSADMANLQASTVGTTPGGQLSVFAYKYKSVVVGGKTYWIVHVTARTVMCHVKTS
jgi:hypothetical protein